MNCEVRPGSQLGLSCALEVGEDYVHASLPESQRPLVINCAVRSVYRLLNSERLFFRLRVEPEP